MQIRPPKRNRVIGNGAWSSSKGYVGTNDYSAWKYTITPKYTSIKQNKTR